MKNVFLIIIVLGGMLTSCSGAGNNQNAKTNDEQTQTDGHNARNALDYQGTYEGTILDKTHSVIKVSIILTDKEYTLNLSPLKKGSKTIVEKGKINWNNSGTTITLGGAKELSISGFFVGEGQLTQLDESGKRRTGEDAKNYVLRKQWEH